MARMYISERPPVPIRAMRVFPPSLAVACAAAAADVVSAVLTMGSLSKAHLRPWERRLWIGGGTLLCPDWQAGEKAFSRLSIKVVPTRRGIRQPFPVLEESAFFPAGSHPRPPGGE